jgi:hypothetical protein
MEIKLIEGDRSAQAILSGLKRRAHKVDHAVRGI